MLVLSPAAVQLPAAAAAAAAAGSHLSTSQYMSPAVAGVQSAAVQNIAGYRWPQHTNTYVV